MKPSFALYLAGLLISLCCVVVLGPTRAEAQAPVMIEVSLAETQIVYTGPGQNAGWVEYLQSGRVVTAIGRNIAGDWIEILIDRQVRGWVPLGGLNPVGGDVSSLRVAEGLLDLGGGAYSITDDRLRVAEVELIRVGRQMRYMGARWFRLQDFINTTCEAIPASPAPVAFSAAQLASVPELERIQRELNFVQQHTEDAIAIFEQLCSEGELIQEEAFRRGSLAINRAFNAWDVVRKYINELGGLQKVTS